MTSTNESALDAVNATTFAPASETTKRGRLWLEFALRAGETGQSQLGGARLWLADERLRAGGAG